jgi:hypothetical protein
MTSYVAMKTAAMPVRQTQTNPKTMKVFMWNVSSPMADLLFTVSNWLLIVGALAIFIGTIGAFTMSAAKEYFANERTIANEAEIARAGMAAETARADAAKASERAAVAELELAKFKAPRTLTLSEQRGIADKLKDFPGVTIDIFIYGETPEIVQLTKLLTPPLSEAGWAPRTWVATGGGAVTGILIVPRKDSPQSIFDAATALAEALKAAHLDAAIWEPFDPSDVPATLIGPPWDTSKAAPMRMLIGIKP